MSQVYPRLGSGLASALARAARAAVAPPAHGRAAGRFVASKASAFDGDVVSSGAREYLADPKCARSFHREFVDRGFVLLPGFVTAAAAADMAAEATALSAGAFRSGSSHGLFLEDVPVDSGPEHRERLETRLGSIAYDELSADRALVRLYRDDRFVSFVGAVVTGSWGGLHRLADPLGACSVNVYQPDDRHACELPKWVNTSADPTGRGQSPVEWGEIPFIHPSICSLAWLRAPEACLRPSEAFLRPSEACLRPV